MTSNNLVRPSRDGDQFHYLWAARRCLLLLHPLTDLVAITIEGSSPAETRGQVPLDGEDVIDVAEYHGDQSLTKATGVRYRQLKHSTRHAEEPWTASGLEKTLIGFSDRYKSLLKDFPSEDVAKRFSFHFVTNRPVSQAILETIDDAAKDQQSRHPKELQKLESFTGLSGAALSSFCQLLHFAERQEALWDQRNILIQASSGYLPDADVDAPTQLKELVTRKALSESEGNPAITKVDVLRALKTDETRLYPAELLIQLPPDFVPREQEAELVEAIVRAGGNPVIVHAEAGVGKSMLSCRIGPGLVQQPPAPGADRQHPAGGSRGQLLRQPGGTEDRRLTQMKQPPENPGRFKPISMNRCDEVRQYLGQMRYVRVAGSRVFLRPSISSGL